MSIFGWGSTTHGQLGLGGIENEQIAIPIEMPWEGEGNIVYIACGRQHTLFLTSEGKVYACGDNDDGQLGHDSPTKRPQLISELQNHVIVKVTCGSLHSIALTEWGQLYSWGQNEFGQLGQRAATSCRSPKLIRELAAKIVVQVASGHNHNIALTNSGELYAWGSNIYGQLGLAGGRERAVIRLPELITSLPGVPIAHVSCGGFHSFVVSKSGAIFCWGRNSCGQLGLNDTSNRSVPTHLRAMRSLGVRYIACGEEFSVFLTYEGRVFSCGNGMYGQLGHGSDSNELLPRQVIELMGSVVTQIACGLRHTLALVPSRGRVYAFGLGGSGQLGTRIKKNAFMPQIVIGPWVSLTSDSLIENKSSELVSDPAPENAIKFVIKQIFSGGDHSMAITSNREDKIAPHDYRIYEPRSQILTLTLELARNCAALPAIADPANVELFFTPLETIFTSIACINGSFLEDGAIDRQICCSTRYHGINLAEAREAFCKLGCVLSEGMKQMIFDKITGELLKALIPSPPDVEALRIYLLLPLYREFVNSKNYEKLHTPFTTAVYKLPQHPMKVLINWLAQAPVDYFEYLVNINKDVVSHIITFSAPPRNHDGRPTVSYNKHLNAALDMMKLLHRINNTHRAVKVSYESFCWNELTEYADIQQDYIQWLFLKNREVFNICNYPFLFNAAAKTALLQADQAIQMHNAMQNAVHHNIMSMLSLASAPAVSHFTLLEVSRANIVHDTLAEISKYNQNDLKKPLKIKFRNEEAEDAGGLRKEFFLLLLREIFDAKYGMFRVFGETHCVWFANVTFESEEMYLLIGVLCGLAIYNFIIINIPFPLALYKKLLKEPTDLSDLHAVSPIEARSLQSVLDYEGDDLVEVFDLCFEISQDVYGHIQTVPLKPGGSSIRVTQENKQEYVNLYVNYVFNEGVKTQYNAFEKGFMKVCAGLILQLFRPHELMALVIGNEDYDWDVFERNCEYRGSYTPLDQTIKWFWEVFHEYPLSEKKKFLLFLTGSDRVPIEGMKALQIYIQPTSDDRYLPVAHTCFNLLDLPRYKTKERLKFKLQQAIQQTHGFSLV